ncbi:MAG: A/G-specific adenine glycosylase [Betaproteobacteria bacterium]
MNPFAARVVARQHRHGRHDLPWQQGHDAYRTWLSEIMLQQTQVATVLPYYRRFVVEFPEVARLAAAPLERVLELWSGLGYYRRAHHLHAAAVIVTREHHGVFPTDAATLATLPGIGRSTAAAIAAFASAECNAILDGNVKRVLARHQGIAGWSGEPRVHAALWQAAERLVPRDPADIRAYTQGVMDIGATVCTRTRPRCDACPVAVDCVARSAQRIAELPAPRPRKAFPRREVTVLMLEWNGAILLERRPALGIWGGLWSLPEIPRETDVTAFVGAHLAATAGSLQWLPPLEHGFTHFALTLHPVRVEVLQWPPAARMPGVEWFGREAALAAAIPAPIRKLLRSGDPGDFRLTG